MSWHVTVSLPRIVEFDCSIVLLERTIEGMLIEDDCCTQRRKQPKPVRERRTQISRISLFFLQSNCSSAVHSSSNYVSPFLSDKGRSNDEMNCNNLKILLNYFHSHTDTFILQGIFTQSETLFALQLWQLDHKKNKNGGLKLKKAPIRSNLCKDTPTVAKKGSSRGR